MKSHVGILCKVVTGAISVGLLLTSTSISAQASSRSPEGATTSTIGSVGIRKLNYKQTMEVIEKARRKDSDALSGRRTTLTESRAFMEVLRTTTGDPESALDFFAAVSTQEQAQAFAANTAGQHYVISGTEGEPTVVLAPGDPQVVDPGIQPMAMPACGKAWAAFAAWLAGTTMLCAPFSGPAAWACAVGMGLLGLMPDFNKAC